MCHITDITTLQTQYAEAILATYLVGSRAYGTATPESDEDYRGIFVLPSQAYLSIREPVAQVSDERNNTTYYTLKRFLELAATANPNIIEMLFMPDDCVVFESPLMQRLLQSRDMFITKQAYSSMSITPCRKSNAPKDKTNGSTTPNRSPARPKRISAG